MIEQVEEALCVTGLRESRLKMYRERVQLPDESIDPDYVSQHNAALEWV